MALKRKHVPNGCLSLACAGYLTCLAAPQNTFFIGSFIGVVSLKRKHVPKSCLAATVSLPYILAN